MEWKRSRRPFVSRRSLFYCVLVSLCALLCIISARRLRTVRLDIVSSSVGAKDYYFQEFEKTTEEEKEMISSSSSRNGFWSMRRLNGLGSYPPRCTSKCGKCTPCKPVHVPVPPGTQVPTEYYPEAWRCKCGNKLYMP